MQKNAKKNIEINATSGTVHVLQKNRFPEVAYFFFAFLIACFFAFSWATAFGVALSGCLFFACFLFAFESSFTMSRISWILLH